MVVWRSVNMKILLRRLLLHALHRHVGLSILHVRLLLLLLVSGEGVALVIDGHAHDRLALAVRNLLLVLHLLHLLHLLLVTHLVHCNIAIRDLLLLRHGCQQAGQTAEAALAEPEHGLKDAEGSEHTSIVFVSGRVVPLSIFVG